ncbi:hypothetical protein SAMN06265222_11167 [Neorhodopirellula lusitana]|uniref:Uncharacterized protein n=1 Tax=Neorhodopirellula lusitana TaxID=445327 RepID=A0ABY1QH78_9BACT|nr:hypothetical protein SAMN06265222_11167 [Neorhodopirellula lusitana]
MRRVSCCCVCGASIQTLRTGCERVRLVLQAIRFVPPVDLIYQLGVFLLANASMPLVADSVVHAVALSAAAAEI